MILVIEPDDETLELITIWLEHDGFRVIALDRPEDALMLLARTQTGAIKAVFCAAVMPGFQIQDLIERLRALANETKIFVMSGFDEPIPEIIASLPVQGLLTKPLVKEDVRRCLAGVIAPS